MMALVGISVCVLGVWVSVRLGVLCVVLCVPLHLDPPSSLLILRDLYVQRFSVLLLLLLLLLHFLRYL